MGIGFLSIPAKKIKTLFGGRIEFDEFDAGTNRLENVGEATEPTDAPNLGQVEGLIAEIPGVEPEVTQEEFGELEGRVSSLEGEEGLAGLEGRVDGLEVARGIPQIPEIMGIRAGRVDLNGEAPVQVRFGVAQAPEIKGTQTAPFTIASSGHTLKATADGGAEKTATFTFVAGSHLSGEDPATNLQTEVDNAFLIAVDGDVDSETFHLVELVNTSLDSGAAIATEMQAKIRALTGIYAAVEVAYQTTPNHYKITSGTKGTGSKVAIQHAPTNDVCDELKIGTDGTSTGGTGNVANGAAVTIEEALDIIGTAFTTFDVVEGEGADEGKIILRSKTADEASSVLIGAGTANAALGFTEAAKVLGEKGLGYETDMEDDAYVVVLVMEGTAQGDLGDMELSIIDKSTSGFKIACETLAATETIAFAIFGVPAEPV